jgi:hypothetical protein
MVHAPKDRAADGHSSLEVWVVMSYLNEADILEACT